MAQDGNQFQKPLPKTAFNEYKLRLKGPMQEGGKFPPNLSVSVIKNQPRIDVFTEVPNDTNRGKITAAMDTLTFFALLEALKLIIDGEPDQQLKVPNMTGAPQNKSLATTTLVGKDKEGRVYISVVAKGRPMIKFVFSPSDYHPGMIRKDGVELDEAELSVIYARAWRRLMIELTPNVLDSYYEAPEPRNKAGGNGNFNKGNGNYNKGSNNYNQGNGGGGGSAPAQSEHYGEQPAGPPGDFDDFPM
jgi:hypothetical protein